MLGTIRQWHANRAPAQPWITCGDNGGYSVECYTNDSGTKIVGVEVYHGNKCIGRIGYIPAEIINAEIGLN